jgi:hypothetical protein
MNNNFKLDVQKYYYEKSKLLETKSGNKISRKSLIKGYDSI